MTSRRSDAAGCRGETDSRSRRYRHKGLVLDGRPVGGNAVLVAADGPLPPEHRPVADGASIFERPALVHLVAGAEPLRDDYAPVDQLETRPG